MNTTTFAHTTSSRNASFTPTADIAALPAGLRAAAAGMQWSDICATYAPQSGPIRLGSFSTERLGLGHFRFRATLAIADTIDQYATEATGPVSAMTQMLAAAGTNLEIRSFHQYQAGSQSRTFVLVEHRGRRHWALGLGGDAVESACRAMVAAANRSLA